MDARILSHARNPRVGATQCTEVRWFVPGGGPPLEGGSVRSCVDSYCGEMLAEGVSVKSRVGHGAGIFAKLRSAVLAPIAVGELRGTPETWARWELGALPPTNTDVHVHKDIERRKGVEVAHLVMNDERWWSVAVRIRGSELADLPLALEEFLSRRGGDLLCCSYPAWLVRHANPESRRDVASQLSLVPLGRPRRLRRKGGQSAQPATQSDDPHVRNLATRLVRFSLPDSVHATTIAVVGDFNDWSPDRHVMEHRVEGGFALAVELEVGRAYHYRYLLDGQRWENDYNADYFAANPHGGDDSVIDLRNHAVSLRDSHSTASG